MSPARVLDFWFDPANRRCWFRSTPQLDQRIRARFEPLWERAREGALAAWEADARGALALVIVLDQFPLNMFRGQARAFASEDLAVKVAGRAVGRGLDGELESVEKSFLYLPFMHSESLAHQDCAVALYGAAGLQDNLRWARHHREIIRRFGRFPHRNPILGRASTAEELAWLSSSGAFMG